MGSIGAWLLEYDPWQQRLQLRRSALPLRLASTVRNWIIVGVIVVALTIGACFTTPGYVRLAPLIWVLALIGLVAAWRTPTFAPPELRAPASLIAGDLCCVVPVAVAKSESVRSPIVHIVSEVVVTGDSPDDDVWLAFADGDALVVHRNQGVAVSRPLDLFARLRSGDHATWNAPERPSVTSLAALRALWRLTDGGVGSLSVQRLQHELGCDTDAIEAFIVEGRRLRLILDTHVDRRSPTHSSVSLTQAGMIAAIASDAIEVAAETPDSQKPEEPQVHAPVFMNNYGVINYGSPGAAGNVGNGSASVVFSIHLRDSLVALADAVPQIAPHVDDAKASELATAADEIRRGLDDPIRNQDMLRRAAALIVGVGGELVMSILGGAAWDAVKLWLGI